MKPEYTRDETLYPVPTEAHVPNDDRVLPTQRGLILALAVAGALLAVLALVLALGLEWEGAALILAAVGLFAAAISAVMAHGDARAGMTTPVLSTVAALVLLLIVALDWADTGDAVEPDAPADAIVGPAPTDLPEDPAAIIEGDHARETNDAGRASQRQAPDR